MNEPPLTEPSAVPQALKDEPQWICWSEQDRDGKPTKVPIDPASGSFASTTDAETWHDFETALRTASDGPHEGVGFVFTDDDDFVGVDLDDCRDPETAVPTDHVQEIIDRLDSYTEVSPSGTGYHVIVRGELPDGRNRKGSVEMYDSARFFTVTGDHVDGTPTAVRNRANALVAVHRDYVQEETSTPTRERNSSAVSRTTFSDDDLLEKARNAANGKKFQDLWAGSTAGYESHSEADMALCCLLAFWTGGDQRQMDRLFRRSGLMREKWDEVHYADGSTYGEMTIARAVENTSEYYEPPQGKDQGAKHHPRDQAIRTKERETTGAASNDDVRERLFAVETTLDHVESQLASLEETVERLESVLAEEREQRREIVDRLASNSGRSVFDRFRG